MYSLGLVLIELLGRRIKDPVSLSEGAHDDAIEHLIDSIPDFGLPNAGWDNSLRETLMRLCASDVENRLDARQTVKLMRAFKEQATGDGLVAFAEDTVTELTLPMAAFPEANQASGEPKGAQFSLESDGRTSMLKRGDGQLWRLDSEAITRPISVASRGQNRDFRRLERASSPRSHATPPYAAFPRRFLPTSLTKLNSDASNSPITVNTPPTIAHIDVRKWYVGAYRSTLSMPISEMS